MKIGKPIRIYEIESDPMRELRPQPQPERKIEKAPEKKREKVLVPAK